MLGRRLLLESDLDDMAGAIFQAFARDGSGVTVRSNIVTVGWAGDSAWNWFFTQPPSSTTLAEHGCVTFMSDGTMSWNGQANYGGTWTRQGNTVTLHWDTGSLDTLTLNGRTLTGHNNATPTPWMIQGIERTSPCPPGP
jgi:hypothetical protein